MKKQAFLVTILFLLFLFFHFNQTKEIQKTPNEPDLNFLVIQKINVSAPIIYSNSSEEEVIQKNLESGVVHLPNTASPGEIGNVYIVGHSSDYVLNPGKYKKVFSELEKLKNKDEILLSYKNSTYKYKVYDIKVIEASDFTALSQETFGRKLLTLQTSYPINTALKRLIILAELFQKSDNR